MPGNLFEHRRWKAPLAAAGVALACALAAGPATAQSGSSGRFAVDANDDRQAEPHPRWFKRSTLDLRADLRDARLAGKNGLVVYFGQAHCPYCIALIDVNFGRETDIVDYTRRHFDVVALDAWGDRAVTDLQGATLSETALAAREDADFTPTLVFYDAGGREALRLRGYYSPYRFRAGLAYVVEGFYERESFRDYLARADPPPKFDLQEIAEESFFADSPYDLDRSRQAAQKPLLVFFEQRNCHACDILHGAPLRDPQTRKLLRAVRSVQLDVRSDTPLTTPGGKRSTARAWAADLDLGLAPVLVFFDERGREILRLDSVQSLYQLRAALEFVSSRAYLQSPSFERWQALHAARLQSPGDSPTR